MTFTYELDGTTPNATATDLDLVRYLLNDVDQDTAVFTDEELNAVLALEGSVKLAAAQAIDTNADNELLASKVLKTQDVQTDGAKLADALHKRADALRRQHYETTEGDGFFDIIPGSGECVAELAPGPSWY